MRAPRDELPERRVGGRSGGKRRARVAQPLSDAIAELRRRGVREGDDQDAIDRKLSFDDEAYEKGGDGVRLAGAGAGLDELDATEPDAERIERRHAGTA